MEDFFVKSYSGLYCALCDSKTHQFVDLENQTISLSKDYCRNFLNKSLDFLIYFKYDYLKVMNLGEFFLTTCNYKNQFEDVDFPKSY